MSEGPSLEEVRQQALTLGWDDVGVTSPEIPEEDIASYQEWIEKGYHCQLSYMENELRLNPQRLLPGAKSAILFVTNYKQPKLPFHSDGRGLIASYARKRDYHHVHRSRIKRFIRWLEERTEQKEIALGFSDSKPILEKALFVKAGLGWFGKNTLLIHRQFGTFILLSGILTTLSFNLPKPISTRTPRCGVCTKCLDACPTRALISPYKLDASRCLAYHLIESKEPLPTAIAQANPGYAFGCDICQDVCPHNVRSPLSICSDFIPESTEEAYLTLEKVKTKSFNGTPLKRRGAEGLSWNLLSL